MTNKEKPICTGGLRILMNPNTKQAKKDWERLCNNAYKGQGK